MAIPTLITELSETAALNAPAGSDSPSTLDDIQRAHASFIAQLRDRDSAFALTLLDDADAAAARTTLGAAASGANSDITSLTNLTGGALVTGAALFGYSAGSGGTVTQATSKSTAVTLNKPTGVITVNGASLAAGSTVQFVLNNTLIGASEILLVSQYGFITNTAAYQYWANASSAGQAVINIKNLTAGSLSDAMTVQFAVIKGTTV